MKVGFLNLLTLVFVLAKLFGAITWSWWLVFLPTLVGAGIIITLLVLAIIIAALE